ncbi:MAG: 2'-5' RNA ligase family protein [Clostridium sp.]|uniref:2'-5' RNA ligase family protein n=1 Tax=Clostridium sp. TaxID=1506 RepID=UPI0030434767
MYAVEFFFNEEVDLYIRSIWKALSDANIDSSLNNIEEISPHITLAVYQNINEEAFIEKFKAFKSNFKPINTSFDILGTFPTTGICLIKPTVTEELLKFHGKYHEQFKSFNETASPYYLPNRWSPHCTLAINLSNDNLKKVFSFALDKFKPLNVTLNDVGLIKICSNNDNCERSVRLD